MTIHAYIHASSSKRVDVEAGIDEGAYERWRRRISVGSSHEPVVPRPYSSVFDTRGRQTVTTWSAEHKNIGQIEEQSTQDASSGE